MQARWWIPGWGKGGGQVVGLCEESAPVECASPGKLEGVAGKNFGGIDGLPELPVGESCGADEGIEELRGLRGGLMGACLVPGFGPAEVVGMCGGFDRSLRENLQEGRVCGAGGVFELHGVVAECS